MKSTPEISVIIPSYNRPESIRQTLHALRAQTIEPARFEVIVVDDGSSSGPLSFKQDEFPFAFQYIYKENQGATIARNTGAAQARGELIVFIDDDVRVHAQSLEALQEKVLANPQIVGLGTLISRHGDLGNPFSRGAVRGENRYALNAVKGGGDQEVPFTRCNTQLLAVRRDDFFALGMLQDPTGGWPNWDDVDFGYRAHLKGFRIMQVARAVGEHWDYSLADLKSASRRWFRASKSAVKLFMKYPDLLDHLPMLKDKVPVQLGQDSPALILKKQVRAIVSSQLSLWSMEKIVAWLEKRNKESRLLPPFYQLITAGYMYQGYQSGLRELNGQVRRKKQAFSRSGEA